MVLIHSKLFITEMLKMKKQQQQRLLTGNITTHAILICKTYYCQTHISGISQQAVYNLYQQILRDKLLDELWSWLLASRTWFRPQVCQAPSPFQHRVLSPTHEQLGKQKLHGETVHGLAILWAKVLWVLLRTITLPFCFFSVNYKITPGTHGNI